MAVTIMLGVGPPVKDGVGWIVGVWTGDVPVNVTGAFGVTLTTGGCPPVKDGVGKGVGVITGDVPVNVVGAFGVIVMI